MVVHHCARLRRYNLDSVKPAPTVISGFHLAAFLSSLKGQGYTTFVVRPEVGDLPAPGTMQTRNNSQFYLTQREIDGTTSILSFACFEEQTEKKRSFSRRRQRHMGVYLSWFG